MWKLLNNENWLSIIAVGKRSAEQLLTRVMRSNDFLIRALRSHSTVTLTIWLAKSTVFPNRILIFSLEEFPACKNTDGIRILREFEFRWNSGRKSRFKADSLTQTPSFLGSVQYYQIEEKNWPVHLPKSAKWPNESKKSFEKPHWYYWVPKGRSCHYLKMYNYIYF